MNKIYRLKWNRSRNCWSVCSELGSRVKEKKSRAVLISAISLYSSLVFADDVIVNQDKTIDFGKENQSIDYRITVTDNANLVINTTDTSRPRLTLASGGGLDITGGKVTINGPLNFLLKGTGFLNVSNAGSELYADDLYESNSGMRHDQGYFNVSNGGKIHVKGTSRLTYTQGNVSGEGSQVNAGTFFMGVYGGYGGNQFLSVNNGGEVNAREHISLGYYDQRSDTTLVVSDGGKISAPKISLSTNSELALGAQEGSAAKAAGIIDAEKIEFVWAKTSDKKITLNHTDKNATISADIVSGSEGLGYINALNGTTYLTGDNSAFSGKVKIEQNGALGITQNIGTAEINNRGKLHLKADDSMTFANKISGNGTISIDSGTVALTGNNYAFSGYIDVASGAVAVISEDKNIGRADLDVDGKLQINANKDWVFDNDLQGRGIVEINMGNHEFSFDEFAYTDWFQGSLAFQNTTFNLEKNAEFLQRGGITAGQGSQVTVGKGAHSISTLGFSGGTVDFGALTAGAQMTEGTVNVSKTLDLRGEGVIQVNDFPGFYDWMDYPDHPVKFVFRILENQKGTVWVYDQDDAFLDIKANVQAGRFTGLKKLVQFIDSVRTDCKCILLEHHMPLLRIFPKGKECMRVEKWLREMSSIPETDAPIKQALAHGLLLHLKNIHPVFPESLVMLLLSVLDVKTYRDDARLNEWISNRVQELGDRYYPVNKHVKIRYTL